MASYTNFSIWSLFLCEYYPPLQIKLLNDEILDLKKKFPAHSNADEEKKKLQAELEENKHQINRFKDDIQDLETKFAAEASSKLAFKAASEAQQQEVKAVHDQIAKVTMDLLNLSIENDALKQQLTAKNDAAKGLQDQIGGLRGELAYSNVQLQEEKNWNAALIRLLQKTFNSVLFSFRNIINKPLIHDFCRYIFA